MTNILKDARGDAAEGRSFIPPVFVDFSSGDYRLDRPRGRALFQRAVGFLDEGLRYVQAVPPGEAGIRSFLLGALLPAVATLQVTWAGDSDSPKITRADMQEIVSLIREHVADDAALERWYHYRRDALGAAVGGDDV
jgi:hypothetical protein